MATALRLTKLDSNGDPISNINFEQYEVTVGQVRGNQRSNQQDAQTGNPTFIIIGDEYISVAITFRNHGPTTETKLNELRNFIKAGGIVRLYPKYIDAASSCYDCFVDPATIPIMDIFSGKARGDGRIKLLFRETDQASEVVISEEITIE